ncbi:SusD/RagB family nutrient-binding outer membrane lipoprotein [Pedobacter sp. L105]|uniref:SusD/RagB family nutrient-binding outer membrane lipoprotein n=1 Tax=Pedobacter sp. L105 TaxID=1641871 RepID=UPI00131CA680|nr:SusD/RagB family nutrient-binding outer membrane lipoprotein [Pedobacter sp. L105]
MNTNHKLINSKSLTKSGRGYTAVICAVLLLTVAGCTKNFEKNNTDGTGIPLSQVSIPTLFPPLQSAIFHDYQTAQNLSADGFAGYMMSPTPFKAAYDLNYGLVDDWDKNGFNDAYTLVMGPLIRIAASGLKKTAPDLWAVGLITKVEAMHRVTDKFGPIPYSQVGKSLTTTPYDSQQAVYTQFFAELDTAVTSLQSYVAANPGKMPYSTYDRIYAGDYTKWIKFANSLRLRLAMHIVKADPATAKIQGEKALNPANGGVLTTVSDDAAIAVAPGSENDYYLLSNDYGDCRLNAAIATYMTGYNDPRLPSYASPATDALFPGQYIGIRIGSAIKAKTDYITYANINISKTFLLATPPEQIMTAAEVWFLKAEASLRGWANSGDAKSDYETGVQTSMQQWGVDGTAYLNDATSTQAAYVDPKNSANNSPAVSTITIKWDAGASQEQMLERILTQKWLAVFPEGQEAWTEFRRTGYPKLFPVVVNTSNGAIDTQTQIRRLAYPSNEYNTNGGEVSKAVQLLGGKDNGGTRVWWDIAKSNF